MATMAAVLLAAGSSTRMGARSKLLLTTNGEPLARRAARALLSVGASPLVVVVPPQSPALCEAFSGLDVQLVENSRRDEGMSTSIAAGVLALKEWEGALAIALGDMPLIESTTIEILWQEFYQSTKGIAAPSYKGRLGHPVIFDLGKYRDRLIDLKGDRGARSILVENPGDLLEVEVDDPGVLIDIDTPEHASEFLRDDEK